MKEQLTLSVDETVYTLAKEGKINSIMIDADTELSKKALEGNHKEVTIREKKGSIKRRVVLVNHVNQGYLGKGYPNSYRTRKRMCRIMIDMVLPETETADEQEKATVK
ncbi:hypothetical protein C900_05394 [Fulvivirga imtechensis AK7]|uniref:Uncharacterized protein n=1 Tax=Fulvivirga imtechensis AK7 TaxID=1237149 RepID=L8JLT5_9BACT|nr:hypothetical protein [Fulvivirga imtechensis]ELR69198.1 hypothetical protein C900_05394 [Fulvivirga imtechensis AK7]